MNEDSNDQTYKPINETLGSSIISSANHSLKNSIIEDQGADKKINAQKFDSMF